MTDSYENYMRRLDQLTSARQNLEQKIAQQSADFEKTVYQRQQELIPRLNQMLILANRCSEEHLFNRKSKKLFLSNSISLHKKDAAGFLDMTDASLHAKYFNSIREHESRLYPPILFSVRIRNPKDRSQIIETMIASGDADKPEGTSLRSGKWLYNHGQYGPGTGLTHISHSVRPEDLNDLLNAFESFEPEFHTWLDSALMTKKGNIQ